MRLEIFVFLAGQVTGTGLGGVWQNRNHRAVAPYIVVIRWLAESLTTCGYQPLDCEGMVAPAISQCLVGDYIIVAAAAVIAAS